MKKLIFSWLLSAMFISSAMAQFGATRTGFEGDNFSLEGALELFKDSRSVQDFERRLNTRTNWVNNLDLDYNGRTDYIRVNHRRQGTLNAIILQVPVDRRYVQDIAVIQIEQTGNRRAVLQMVGDADLYGQNVIIEPYDDFGGVVNVYRWRAVRDILDGFGNPYASPYAFNNYPVWYSPWNQYAWNVYQPRISRFGNYYRVSSFNRLPNVYGFYSPTRAYCPAVTRRTAQVRSRQPVVNRATVNRSATTRTRTTTVPTTRANTRTSATTRTRTASTRATSTRATTQPRATSSRANTTIATTRPSATTRRTTTTTTSRSTAPNTRSTAKPVVRRSTPSRATTAPRVTTRSTSTRATTQRRTVTPSRATSTVKRPTAKPAVRTRTASTSSRKIIKE